MAVGDIRTGLLRNAWTTPFAVAAAGQVVVSAAGPLPRSGLLTIALTVLATNAALYAAMGFLGWVGFGDVKFVLGLSLVLTILAGWLSLLLAPLALMISSLGRLCSPSRSVRRPHGPALVAALTLIAVLSLAFEGSLCAA